MIGNRTRAYLMRILYLWNKTLSSELVRIEKKTIGIFCDDVLYREITQDKENLFFWLLDLGTGKVDSQVLLFLKFIRKNGAYKCDYPLELFKTHVVCFKSKPGFDEAFAKFRQYKYSEMYTQSQLKELKFPEIYQGKVSHTYCVINKDERGLERFKQILRTRFNIQENYMPKTEDIVEYDIPFISNEEILNYDYKRSR